MLFSFMKESNIQHSREVVEQNLARYQPLNYNRFMWWRSYTDGIKPLSKRVTLKERIVNGDFNESSYFMQAQLALHNAKDKVDLNKHNLSDQLDILAMDLTRYKRLMDDFNREDNERLEALYDAFTSTFKMTRNEFIEEICDWPHDLLSYYKFCMEFRYITPAANRKTARRGRPKKIK
mgnify:FL=1